MKLKFFAPFEGESRARVALERNRFNGSAISDGNCKLVTQRPTEGSRRASLHKSAIGNRDSTGRTVAMVIVACDQAVRIGGLIETRVGFGSVVPAGGNRGFK